ncbi:hypothetical protein Tco_0069329, partial [Tanacetum coccineum]
RGDSWGIGAASSVTGMVWLDCGIDGGCEVDGCVWGDKDGEDVILEGDDSGVVSMVGNSGISTPEYPLEALFILLNNFCIRVGVGKANDSNSYITTKLLPSSLLRTQTVENGMNEEFSLRGKIMKRANTIRIFKLEMSSNGGLINKFLDLPIYGSSDSPESIPSCAQSSSLPKLFYRRSIKGCAFSEGILDVTCN